MTSRHLTYDDLQLIAAGADHDTGIIDRVGLLSAAPRTPWWERDDPYYLPWLWSSRPAFAPKEVIFRRRSPSGRILLHRADDFVDPTKEPRAWNATMTAEKSLRTLAALAGWHHLNTKQIAAWIDYNPKQIYRVLRPLYDFGLVQRGHYKLDFPRAGSLSQLHALNLGRPLARWRRQRTDIDTLMSESVVAQVLNNRSPRSRSSNPGALHTRHNVLAAEAVLRILETQPAFTDVSGERASRPRLLMPGDDQAPTMPADATLWRDDGLRVMIELVSSRDERHLARKMRLWASWFASRPLNVTGTVLVFLNANHDRHAQTAAMLRRLHTEIIDTRRLRHANGFRTDPNEIFRARQQIHLASWEDWFPEPWEVSVLGRDVVTAATPDGHSWQAISLADHDEVPYRGDALPIAVRVRHAADPLVGRFAADEPVGPDPPQRALRRPGHAASGQRVRPAHRPRPAARRRLTSRTP